MQRTHLTHGFCGVSLLMFALAAPGYAQTGPCLLADGFETTTAPALPLECTEVPSSSIGMVGVTFATADGDLDATLRGDAGECLGGRLDDTCTWSDRSFETGDEILSVLNWRSAPKRQRWHVATRVGANVPRTRFEVARSYVDTSDCALVFTADVCEGRPGGVPTLVQFPRSDASDPFIGDGFRLRSPANYRWTRLELMMLARHALRLTQVQFPGTRPLELGDISQRDTFTPGVDTGALRHPASSHDQGGNVDFAYFNTLAAGGTQDINAFRSTCAADASNQDGFFCTANAASTHIVDLPRQVYFMAQLFASPRIRVIGADRVIAPLLRAEADRQLGLAIITQAQRDAFYSKLGFGDGWEFQFRMMHVSLRYWGQ